MILPAILIKLIIGVIVYYFGSHIIGLLNRGIKENRVLDILLLIGIFLFVAFGQV